MTPLGLLLLLTSGAAGAVAARALRLPMWPIVGSIVGAAALHLVVGGSSTVPGWWNVIAQILVGTAVGAAIGPGVMREFRAALGPGTLAVMAIVLVGVLCGAGVGMSDAVEIDVALLGMVPGGIGEMVAAATALHADSAVVAGMHVVRLLVVFSALPLLVRWALRWGGTQSEDESP